MSKDRKLYRGKAVAVFKSNRLIRVFANVGAAYDIIGHDLAAGKYHIRPVEIRELKPKR